MHPCGFRVILLFSLNKNRNTKSTISSTNHPSQLYNLHLWHMKQLKQLFAIVLILAYVFSLNGQNEVISHSLFPNAFLGKYAGTLHITNTNGKSDLLMEFHLLKTVSPDTFVYKLVYVTDSIRQSRDYHLISIDLDKGEFLVDENNGILLDTKYIDSTLYSMFEVEGSLLTSTLRFNGDYIDFEITFSKMENKRNSGGEGGDEEMPGVVSYPITVVQKARLFLIEN